MTLLKPSTQALIPGKPEAEWQQRETASTSIRSSEQAGRHVGLFLRSVARPKLLIRIAAGVENTQH